jgi:hypothetical protein
VSQFSIQGVIPCVDRGDSQTRIQEAVCDIGLYCYTNRHSFVYLLVFTVFYYFIILCFGIAVMP